VNAPICEILVIPDVVVIVTLLVGRLLLGLFGLAASWSLHPLVHLKIHELVILLHLVNLFCLVFAITVFLFLRVFTFFLLYVFCCCSSVRSQGLIVD